MDLTTVLTGMLPFVVVISAALTAVVSTLLLRMYRRAVRQSMSVSSGVASPPPEIDSRQASSDNSDLTIRTVVPGEASISGKALDAYEATSASLRRLGTVYVGAGVAYAIVMSLPWMIAAEGGFPPMRLLWLIACYAWPSVLALLLVTPAVSRARSAVIGSYVTVVAFVGAVALARNPTLDLGQLVYFWLFANAAGTLLLATFLTRRVRAVGPLVLAFMVTAVTGAFLAVTVAGSDDAILQAIVVVGTALGVGATGTFVSLHVIGFVLFGVLGWVLLGWLGRAYRTKRMSDQSLTVDACVLAFGVLESITLAFEGWAWTLTGLVAFVTYKLVAGLGFARVAGTGGHADARHPSLLVLRVFALGSRSERLFDALSKRWLRAGSVDLIAGPDLVTSTIEPHEFLEFLGGRLSRRFIGSEEDLNERLANRDTRPDPDGRHRVNEFFCRQNTWQMTMRRLAAGSDAVLMDLRSLSRGNQGCLWELEQLLAGVALDRMVFVTDDTSDRLFLEDAIQTIWRQLPADSPNRGLHQSVVRLFVASGPLPEAAEALVRCLFEAHASETDLRIRTAPSS